jgi:hypothetical protein
LVAKLFKKGDISFTVNGSSITLLNKSDDEIVRFITKKEFVEKLLTERREKANDNQKKTVREVMKEMFGVSSVNDDDDTMMQKFQTYSSHLLNELEKYEIMYQNKPLPGKRVISSGKSLLRAVVQIQSPAEFFAKVYSDRDAYLDFSEDFEPVKAFFNGEQKPIFENALRLMGIYDESKTFIVNEKVEALVAEIKSILKKEIPYSEIPKLPELLEQFINEYNSLLQAIAKPMKEEAAQARERVFEELKGKRCENLLSDRYVNLFAELTEKISACNNVARLQSIRVEIDALKLRLLNEISAKEQELIEKEAKDNQKPVQPDTPLAPPKKKKNISIKSIAVSTSWQIETPQDVDKYMSALKNRILEQLDKDTVINIEL